MDKILGAGVADSGDARLWMPDEDPPEPWKYDAMARFRERMTQSDTPFPCVFGVDATRRGTLRCVFISAGAKRVPQLAQALSSFVDRAVSYGPRTSLVAFFEPVAELRTIQDYRDHFWHLLSGLRQHDQHPWPEGISTDPEDCYWGYGYHGMPLFIVANTPAHQQRRSRQFEYFTITFQPRFVFDDLAEESPAGRRARKVIRKRLQEYDTVPASPTLASFGKPGSREWTQYFLDDTNEPVSSQARCPLGHATSA
jgi:FPC/CPF motif-containing protein YcgG